MKKWILNALSLLFLVFCIVIPLQLTAEGGDGGEDEWQTLEEIEDDYQCLGAPSDCLVITVEGP